MGPHRAAWGRNLAWGPSKKITREKTPGVRCLCCCYSLRWRWANNPLALPSKYPHPC
jgi:hypothetical protein